MRILYDLMHMDDYSAALEADDITEDTEKATQSITGAPGANPNADDENTGDDGKDDPSKTDDIFGIEENKAKANGTDNDDTNTDTTEEENPTDEGGDEDTSDLESMADEEDDTTMDDSSSDKKAAYYDKNKLKSNMIALYKIINSNIKLLSALISKLDNSDDIQNCTIVYNNLISSSNYLYSVLTEQLNEKSYEELLKIYITTKRIFDLCIEILTKHFDNVVKK